MFIYRQSVFNHMISYTWCRSRDDFVLNFIFEIWFTKRYIFTKVKYLFMTDRQTKRLHEFWTFNVRYNAITTVVTVTIRLFVMQYNNVFYCIGVGINIGRYLYASATFLYAEFKVYDNTIKTKICSLYNI